MKKKRIILSAILLAMLLVTYRFFPGAAAAWWAITSIVDVPICTARIADKLGTESDVSAVKRYVVQSLQPGMTSDEVINRLNKISPAHIRNSFIGENKETHMELLIELCDNPLGNMVLLVSFSQDGHLLTVINAYEE